MLNLLLTVVWALAGLLLVCRLRESRGFWFSLEQVPEGLIFKYQLGVYAGRVSLIRDPETKDPHLAGHVFGWECKFPVEFTNRDMLQYIAFQLPVAQKHKSHSKDLLIFNEVVNNHNDALVSINGQIFVYDNNDFRPYRFRNSK